ncbi:MAG TPA: hypothetical protein VML50_11365 [Anaeromyxobacter sp.]|nr:hypothetical protein [Anaeromyxobacter sp.]
MIPPRTPEVRAAHLRTLADGLSVLGAKRAAAVRRLMPPWVMPRIQRARRLDWLPVELLVEMCGAVAAREGDGVLRAWGAASLQGIVRAPLARAAYEVALMLGGRDPATLIGYLLQTWPLLYAGCGEVVVTDVGPASVRIVHSAVPTTLRRQATVLPLLGALESVPSHCGARGRASAEWDPASDRFVYTIGWEREAGGAA